MVEAGSYPAGTNTRKPGFPDDTNGGPVMLQRLTVRTPAQACLVDITGEVQNLVRATGVAEGTVLLYVPHTTCGSPSRRTPTPGCSTTC